MISNKKYFIMNLLSSHANIIVSVLVNFITVPIALTYWGQEVYGIWTIIMSFSAYILISGLGIDSATGHLMTKNSGYREKINIFKKGMLLMCLCCGICTILFSVLYLIFPDWYKVLGKMSIEAYNIAKPVMLVFIAVTILSMPISVVSCSFASFGYAYLNTFLGTFQVFVNLIALLYIRSITGSLYQYVWYWGLGYLGIGFIKIIVLAWIIYKYRKVEILKTEVHCADDSFSVILRMSLNLSLYGLPILIVPNLSNLIISNAIDTASVVPYSIVYKLYYMADTFVMSFNFAILPLLGKEYGNNNWEWVTKNIRRMQNIAILLALLVSVGLIFLSPYVILLWTGSYNNYTGILVTVLLGLWSFLYCMNNLSLVLINSFNYTDKVWIISWCESGLFLLVSILLVQKIGVAAIALGLFISLACVSAWAYPLKVYKDSAKRIFFDKRILFKALLFLIILGGYALFIDYAIHDATIKIVINIVSCITICFATLLIVPKDTLIFIKTVIFRKKNIT